MGSEAYEKIKAGLEEALALAEAEKEKARAIAEAKEEKEAQELAASKGFIYWPGGENPPADWDGEELLVRGGRTWHPGRMRVTWSHESDGLRRTGDIIGYHKKPREPLWEPLSPDQEYAILQGLDMFRSKAAGLKLAEEADKLLRALMAGHRTLGVTCDPV